MAFTLKLKTCVFMRLFAIMMALQFARPPAPSKGEDRYREGEQVLPGELLEESKERCHLPVWAQKYNWWNTAEKYLQGFWQWSPSTPALCKEQAFTLVLQHFLCWRLFTPAQDCKGVNTAGEDKARMAFVSHYWKPEVVGWKVTLWRLSDIQETFLFRSFG